MRRRRPKRSSELTPLIDMLFILLFAVLVQSQRAGNQASIAAPVSPSSASGPSPQTPADAAPGDSQAMADAARPADGAASLPLKPADEHIDRARKLAEVMAQSVKQRDVFVVEVTGQGEIAAMERFSGGMRRRRDQTDYRLLRPVLPGQSDAELRYLGDAEPASRLCPLVKQHFEPAADALRALVIVVTDAPLARFPLALRDGLIADTAECYAEAGAIAVVIDTDLERDVWTP